MKHSHHPESTSSRADKMSGLNRPHKDRLTATQRKSIKQFYNRKRRMFLKTNQEKTWKNQDFSKFATN